MSAKSPAFQFYPGEFLAGSVATYSLDEIGAYITLLSFDWSLNGLPNDIEKLAKLCRINARKFRALWANISEQFEEIDGKLHNPRLAKERVKQDLWRAKSSVGGKNSAKGRGKGGSRVVEAEGQPNGNTSSSSSTSVTTTTTALSPAAPSDEPDAPPAPPVRPSMAPAKRPHVAGAPETESSLTRLPKATVDAAHERWVATAGGVDYGRFRKALLLVFNAQPLVYNGEQLARGVEAFHESASSDGSKWRGKWTVEKFAAEIHEWVKLGAIELVDEWGQPTERGRAAGIFA